VSRGFIGSKTFPSIKRGVLGLGLKLVSGFVKAVHGKLFVTNKYGRHYVTIDKNGTALVEKVDNPKLQGTRIELFIPEDSWNPEIPDYAESIIRFNEMIQGKKMFTKSCVYWIEREEFNEILMGFNRYEVRDLTGLLGANFELRKKARKEIEVFTRAFPEGAKISGLDNIKIDELYTLLKEHTRNIGRNDIGKIGTMKGIEGVEEGYYYIKKGYTENRPYVIEGWLVRDNRFKLLDVFFNYSKSPGNEIIELENNKFKVLNDNLNWKAIDLTPLENAGFKILIHIATPPMENINLAKQLSNVTELKRETKGVANLIYDRFRKKNGLMRKRRETYLNPDKYEYYIRIGGKTNWKKFYIDDLKKEAEIVKEENMGHLTVRKLFYYLAVHGYFENTQDDYQSFDRDLTAARKEGLIDIDFEDLSRTPMYPLNLIESVSDIKERIDERINRVLSFPSLDIRYFWKDQPFYVIFWYEKLALSGVFEEIRNRYNILVLPTHGFNSFTSVENELRDVRDKIDQGKRVVLLFLSDLDPSGITMLNAIVNEQILTKKGLKILQIDKEEIVLCHTETEYEKAIKDTNKKIIAYRVGMTKEHAEMYRLNGIRGKETDPNAEKFKEKYPEYYNKENGEFTVFELDELKVKDMLEIVGNPIDKVYDKSFENKEELKKAKEIMNKITTISDGMTSEIKQIIYKVLF